MFFRKFWLAVGCAVALVCGADAAEKTVRVALAGSSACQAYGNTDPKLIVGWGEVIGKFFKPGVEIGNFAISGYSTKMFIDKGQWQKLLNFKPNYIVMSLGANDSKSDPARYTDPATTYRENLRRFARDAEAVGSEIIFITPNQSLTFNRNGKIERKDRIPYCEAMRKVAADLKKPCLNLDLVQAEALEKIGPEEGRKLYRLIPEKKMELDPSHTNLAGAEMVAALIVGELKKSPSLLKNQLK